jgi:hypothetical protein
MCGTDVPGERCPECNTRADATLCPNCDNPEASAIHCSCCGWQKGDQMKAWARDE